MQNIISMYSLKFPTVIAYMLQSTEYDSSAYVKWLLRTSDFSSVMKRRSLDKTRIARAFVLFVSAGIALQIGSAVMCCVLAYVHSSAALALASIVLLLLAPILWAYLVIIPMLVAKHLIITPKENKQRLETKQILGAHPAVKIAVAGSYGKTTMKEILTTVLAEGKRVAATPGNKNVAAAHYQFAKSLKGDEEVLIIELGEGRPGDVKQFGDTLQPDIAVITGIAPAHLDHYSSVRQAGEDIFSLGDVVKPDNMYVNAESPDASMFIRDNYVLFNKKSVGDWKVSDSKLTIHGTKFTLAKGSQKINLSTGLLGSHLVGVASAGAVIASKLGLTVKQVELGLSKTTPYEHRMQPYQLGGAWVIDDSYNGNLEGIKAGTELLASLSAKRKIYVTPGLVDQGQDTKVIHHKAGELIATAKPDVVVLMKNSVTSSIADGLRSAGFTGELLIQTDPLKFYQHLDQFVATGDIVMLQNDWTDNYY